MSLSSCCHPRLTSPPRRSQHGPRAFVTALDLAGHLGLTALNHGVRETAAVPRELLPREPLRRVRGNTSGGSCHSGLPALPAHPGPRVVEDPFRTAGHRLADPPTPALSTCWLPALSITMTPDDQRYDRVHPERHEHAHPCVSPVPPTHHLDHLPDPRWACRGQFCAARPLVGPPASEAGTAAALT
jgi:hypothetical protein